MGSSQRESKPLISNESPVIVAGLIFLIPDKLVIGIARIYSPPAIEVMPDSPEISVSTAPPLIVKFPFTEVKPANPVKLVKLSFTARSNEPPKAPVTPDNSFKLVTLVPRIAKSPVTEVIPDSPDKLGTMLATIYR